MASTPHTVENACRVVRADLDARQEDARTLKERCERAFAYCDNYEHRADAEALEVWCGAVYFKGEPQYVGRLMAEFTEQLTKAATDNDCSDDATGLARRKAAMEAREMREKARERMMQKNLEMKAKIANTAARTDDVCVLGRQRAVCPRLV